MPPQQVVSSDADAELAWDVPRLWELAKALPVKTVPLAEFAFHFDSTCYFGPAGITVRQLADMIGLVLRADLSYPIILAAEGWIMDGRSDGYLAAGGPAYPRTVDTVGRPALP